MTSTSSSQKRLKLLCMHGFGTNKQFMKMQTQILRRDLESLAEFIFVDGPIEVPITMINDPKVVKNIVGSPCSWFDPKTSHKTRSKEENTLSLNKIRKNIEDASDYYDGALCFSQGSMAFQILLWYQEQGFINWPILKNIKFFINFSADSYRISLKSLNFKRFQIPSLHFLSEEDFLFSRCLISPTLFQSPELIYHSFGHRFPVLGAREKAQLRNFLKRYGFGRDGKRGIQQQSRL